MPWARASDRAGPAHRVHLVDTEHPSGAQDEGVHAVVEVGLRRRCQRNGSDARDLSRDDVHDDTRRIDRLASGDVEADPIDRLPTLGDLGAVGDLGDCRSRHLRPTGDAFTRDDLVESRPDVPRQLGNRSGDRGRVDANRDGSAAVESFRLLVQCVDATGANILNQVGGDREGRSHVDLGAVHETTQFRG